MQHSVSTISEQVTEMDSKIPARFIVTQVLGPIVQIDIVLLPTLWMVAGHGAMARQEVNEGATSKTESFQAGPKGRSCTLCENHRKRVKSEGHIACMLDAVSFCFNNGEQMRLVCQFVVTSLQAAMYL